MNTLTAHRAPIHNPALARAIYLLSRPVTLGAIALLFLNDHLLRRLWPTWWTGKLGDFAWLFFTPFAAAALLAWLIPARVRRHDTLVGLLAFGLTGLVFALTKSLPEFHRVVVGAAERLFGLPIVIVQDPTDLMALVVLPAGWHMWRKRTVPPGASPGLGWISLPLAALLTIANSGAPDYGIACLALRDERIIASSVYWSYASSDGGLSWQAADGDGRCSAQPESGSVADPANPATLYRYTPGVVIEKSADGGGTWQRDLPLTPSSEAETAYYNKRIGSAMVRPGPFAALADPATGNLIFAMGHEGVLVRQGDGRWRWVPVGEYRRLEFNQAGAFLRLLGGEIWLALGFALLLIGSCGLRQFRTRLRVVVLGIGWALWGLTVAFSPARVSGYGESLLPFILFAAGVFIIPTAVDYGYRVRRSSGRAFGRLLAYAAAGLIAVLLPYALWAINALPDYTLAVVFALVLGATLLVLAYRSVGQHLGQGAGQPPTG